MAAILPPFTNAKILMADMISSCKTQHISQRNNSNESIDSHVITVLEQNSRNTFSSAGRTA
jgi:hypothetical protein